MHFYRKKFTFSLKFQLTISFLFIIRKLWMKTNLFFVLDAQPIDGRKKRKTHAQDITHEGLNTVNTKIVSYTKLKYTVGLSTELPDSLKKLETWKNHLEKNFRKKISDMRSQAKLSKKKAKLLQQLQREHPNAVSALKKLEVTPVQVGRPPLESRMMGLHQAILRYSSS